MMTDVDRPEWTTLPVGFTIPDLSPPRKPLCTCAMIWTPRGWSTDCDNLAIAVQTDDDGQTNYSCREHML